MNPTLQTNSPPLPVPGELVGNRFEILAELGDGGMGHVYRAHDRNLQRNVALKLLTPRYIGRLDREQRFFLEVALGKRVDLHPHLVEILECGRLADRGDWPFITMVLVEGRGLPMDLVLNGPMAPLRAATYARQLADALRTMHAAGVVHRDVCTKNIVLQDDGIVLLDLSHAGDLRAPRVAAGEPGRLTQPHEMIGTYTCMAPEQARAEPPSAAMDVYAFGIAFFELLTARNPYEDKARDSFLERLVAGQVPPPKFPDGKVPQSLMELVSACTDRDPNRRPSMVDIVRRLDLFIATTAAPLAVGATAVPKAERPHGAAVAAVPTVEAAASVGSEVKRWRWIAVTAIVVAVLALALTASLLLRSEPQPVGEDDESASSRTEDTREHAPAVDPHDRKDAGRSAAGPDAKGTTPEPDTATADEPEQTPNGPKVAPPEPPTPTVNSDPAPGVKSPRVPSCDDEPTRAAQADFARDWRAVVRATRNAACWKQQSARIELRARALLNLRRYEECAALPKKHATPETLRIITFCADLTKPQGN